MRAPIYFYIDTDGTTERMKKWEAEAQKYCVKDLPDLDEAFKKIEESILNGTATKMIIIDSIGGTNDSR